MDECVAVMSAADAARIMTSSSSSAGDMTRESVRAAAPTSWVHPGATCAAAGLLLDPLLAIKLIASAASQRADSVSHAVTPSCDSVSTTTSPAADTAGAVVDVATATPTAATQTT